MLLNSRTRRMAVVLALFVPWIVSGCSRVAIEQKRNIDEVAFAERPPRTLAILPLINSTGTNRSADKMRRYLYGALSGLGYEDVELEEVDRRISQLAMEMGLQPDELPPPLIRQADLADAILTGELVDIDRRFYLLYYFISARLHLRMIDTRTADVIYDNQAHAVARRFFITASIPGVVTGLARTVFFFRASEVEEVLEELAQDIAAEFPKPSVVNADRSLFISDIDLDLPRNPLYPGDVVMIEFRGSPDYRAEFDLGRAKRNIPMRESQQGRYVARYTIQPGMEADYAVATARLLDAEGQTLVETAVTDEPFSIVPTGSDITRIEDVQYYEEGVQLVARYYGDKEPARYRFLRADGPNDPARPIGESPEPRYLDSSIEPQNTYYYSVITVNEEGVASEPSPRLRVRAPRHGPLAFAGVIRTDATLQAYSGPYYAQESITVARGATLTALPGVRIHFAPGAKLIVEGTIEFRGSEERPVHLFSEESWGGIEIRSKPEESNILAAVVLEKAETALWMSSGELEARGCVVKFGGRGVVAESESEGFVSACSFISLDQGVVTAAESMLVEKSMFLNCGEGVVVQGGRASVDSSNFIKGRIAARVLAPEMLNLNGNYIGATDPLGIVRRIIGPAQARELAREPLPAGQVGPVVSRDYQALLNSGNRLLSEDKPDEAAGEFAAALLLRREREVFNLLIKALQVGNDWQTALTVGRSAIQIFPEDRDLLLAHTKTLVRLGMQNRAEEIGARVEEISPEDPVLDELFGQD